MNTFLKLITLGTVLVSTSWGASIAVCKGCHGQEWEKSAMDKSKVLKDMSKAEIVEALKGYKDGSYGGTMKGLMVDQVKDLSEEEMEELALKIKQ